MTTEHGVVDVGQPMDEVADDVADEKTIETAPGRGNRMLRACKANWLPLTIVFLFVGAAVLTAGLYRYQYLPDQQTDASVAHQAVEAASNGAVALLSYAPGSLDRDFAAAKAHLTGDFLSYYNQFTDQIVAPAAKQKGVRTTARVVKAGVVELHRDRAVVLVFVNQTATSIAQPEQRVTASSVKVTLTKVNGSWLISKFDPV